MGTLPQDKIKFKKIQKYLIDQNLSKKKKRYETFRLKTARIKI